MEVDEIGLDRTDRKLLLAIIDKFEGGPVGVETLAAATSEDVDTIEDVVRTLSDAAGLFAAHSPGRVATAAAYRHLGRPAAPQAGTETAGVQEALF